MNSIKYLREKKGITQRKLAEDLGIALSSVTHWEQNLRDPNSKMRKKLADYFEVTEADILAATHSISENTTEYKSQHKIPLLSYDQKIKWDKNTFDIPASWDNLIWTDHLGQHLFAIEIKGTEMEPDFKEGDIILIDPDEKIKHSDFVLAQNKKTNQMIFRRYKKAEDVLLLEALNSETETIVMNESNYELIGPMIELTRKFR